METVDMPIQDTFVVWKPKMCFKLKMPSPEPPSKENLKKLWVLAGELASNSEKKGDDKK